MPQSRNTLDENAVSAGDNSIVSRILESETFEKAPALRTLLKYLWENRHEDLNEFRIAVDALGKRTDFNPKTDSTVRVQILRVRQKLKEYYEKEGEQAPVRLVLPTGSHRLQVETAGPETARSSIRAPAWLPWAVAALFALTTLFAILLPRPTPATSALVAPPLARFWQSFTANGKPVKVILPNLAFFRWPTNTIKIRDTRVNGYGELDRSPEFREFIDRWGKPELMNNYTAAPDAYAAADLVAHLARSGIEVDVIGHREAAVEPAGSHNQILLGNVLSGAHLLPHLADSNFEPLNGFSFRNRTPRRGEPAIFPMVIESRRRETVPGLIHRSSRNGVQTLVIMSENTPSLVRLLTTDSGMAALVQAVGSDHMEGSFELLAVAEVEGGRVARTQPAAVRVQR